MGNVLIYALTEEIGGIEEYVLNLTRYKSSKNNYSYIILGEHTPYREEMTKLGVEFFYLPKKRHLFLSIIKTFQLFKRLRFNYETVYFNTSALGYLVPYICAIFFNYRIILHSHLDARKISTMFKKIIHGINYQLIRKNIIVKAACSIPAAKWMFGKDAKQAIIIPNAIKLQRFRYSSDIRNAMKKKLKFSDDVKVIGHVGRLNSVKNQKFLLEIMNYLIKEENNVHLILVGEGENETELREIVNKYKLNSFVTFWGSTVHPEEVMNLFDCMVMPSFAEGFPITLIEAQAAGLSCVVSDVITTEINITGLVDFLSLNVSIEEWCDAIMRAMEKERDGKAITILKQKGYDVYSLENIVSQIIES